MSANCKPAKIHGSHSPNEDAAAVEPFHLGLATAVFALSILFLLGACAATDNGKRDDPAVFGSAGGANGGAGATTGLSFGW